MEGKSKRKGITEKEKVKGRGMERVGRRERRKKVSKEEKEELPTLEASSFSRKISLLVYF